VVDQTFEYKNDGSPLASDTWSLDGGNTDSKGATSITDGSKVWVVDKNDKVYVYNGDGTLQTSWTAGGLNQAEGIATDGTDIWILDKKDKKVRRYNNAATTGDANVDFSFSLAGTNNKAKGITTDGTSIWVVNDDKNSDKVFKYNAADGELLGSWGIDSANSKPTGITIDPSGASTSIWIVDSGSDTVYEYGNALGNSGGNLAGSFALAAGNTNPQGIADPPPAYRLVPAVDSVVPRRNHRRLLPLLTAAGFELFDPGSTGGNNIAAVVAPPNDTMVDPRWHSAPPTYLPPADSRDAVFARFGRSEIEHDDTDLDQESFDALFSDAERLEDLISLNRPADLVHALRN